MKQFQNQLILSILSVVGGLFGIYLYPLILNLIIGGNYVKVLLRLLYTSSFSSTLIILIIFLVVLFALWYHLRKWYFFTSSENNKDGNLLVLVFNKIMAGILFVFLFITNIWVVVMLIIKVFFMRS